MSEYINIDKALVAMQDTYKVRFQTEVINALLAGIPYAGGPITSILFGRAQRKVQERTADVLKAMKDQLESVGQAKVDRDFFESDEFATLFILMLEQIQTTHDQDKLRKLATGLTNSGLHEFAKENRKELFMRIFRDLAPEHIVMLESQKPVNVMGHEDVLPAYDNPREHHLPVLQSLVAHGLMRERFIKPRAPAKNWKRMTPDQIISESTRLFETPPARGFVLTRFGIDFLKFFSEFKSEPSSKSGE